MAGGPERSTSPGSVIGARCRRRDSACPRSSRRCCVLPSPHVDQCEDLLVQEVPPSTRPGRGHNVSEPLTRRIETESVSRKSCSPRRYRWCIRGGSRPLSRGDVARGPPEGRWRFTLVVEPLSSLRPHDADLWEFPRRHRTCEISRRRRQAGQTSSTRRVVRGCR